MSLSSSRLRHGHAPRHAYGGEMRRRSWSVEPRRSARWATSACRRSPQGGSTTHAVEADSAGLDDRSGSIAARVDAPAMGADSPEATDAVARSAPWRPQLRGELAGTLAEARAEQSRTHRRESGASSPGNCRVERVREAQAVLLG